MANPVRTDHSFADLIGMHIDHAEGGAANPIWRPRIVCTIPIKWWA